MRAWPRLLNREFKISLLLSLMIAPGIALARAPCPGGEVFLKEIVSRPKGQVAKVSEEFSRLENTLSKLSENHGSTGKPGAKVVMAALELGHVKGLETISGKSVNISAGGVAAVMNDIAHYYPKLLAAQKGDLTIVGILMDDISTKGMSKGATIKVNVEGHSWEVGTYEYRSPDGAKYVFLDNPSFKRFTASPDPKIKGQSVYTMRGLEAGTQADKLEEQRIWSAINQSIAEVSEHERADIYVPHDSHMSPASFYIEKRKTISPVSLKPLVHNEGYVGNYYVPDHHWDQVRKIWDLKGDDMNEYFMHGDQLIMLAPAVRVAERNEVYSAVSVAKGTADAINGVGHGAKTKTQIEFFDRVGELTNGLGNENRPQFSNLLHPGTLEQLHADGIVDAKVIEHFQKHGYSLPENATEKQILKFKSDAKEAFQRNFGLEVNPNKPLYVSFSRLVHQKGMDFISTNVEHILNSGGQIVVGGPVGDVIGEEARQAFLKLKDKLIAENHPHAKNFVFIDGPVKGRTKGLMLAGGDFFLLPSRYEPCGLTDCEALYNGTIPIAHHTGGLGKGVETILYDAHNADDQGWQLGQAINEANTRYADRSAFQKSQIKAMKQDFSMENNFAKFLSNNRTEVYGKMIKEVESKLQSGYYTPAQAKNILKNRIIDLHHDDLPALGSALKMIHPSRRSPLMEWMIQKVGS